MKNYYKILGLKKNASEEEIRERWVKLMRNLHPDQRSGGTIEDERIREINEAYQVLKHSSTRAEYDLTRAYDHKKRTSYVRKASIPMIILAVLLIGGTVYLKGIQNAIQPRSLTQSKLNQTNQINQINQRNQRNQTDLSREMRSLFHRDQTDQTDQIDPSAHPRIDVSTPQPHDTKSERRNGPMDSRARLSSGQHDVGEAKETRETSGQSAVRRKEVRGSTEKKTLKSSAPADSTMAGPEVAIKVPSITQTDQPVQKAESSKQNAVISKQEDQKSESGETRNVPGEALLPSRRDKFQRETLYSSPRLNHQYNDRDQVDRSTHPRIDTTTHLIATEEEVRKFFVNYVERYTHKDLEGFLSLFSQRAVQNHRDGLEKIRKIYANFFNMSQEIQYSLYETMIEIYQNGVEVKARYEIIQRSKTGEKKLWRGDIRWTLTKEKEALKILSLDYQHHKSP